MCFDQILASLLSWSQALDLELSFNFSKHCNAEPPLLRAPPENLLTSGEKLPPINFLLALLEQAVRQEQEERKEYDRQTVARDHSVSTQRPFHLP